MNDNDVATISSNTISAMHQLQNLICYSHLYMFGITASLRLPRQIQRPAANALPLAGPCWLAKIGDGCGINQINLTAASDIISAWRR